MIQHNCIRDCQENHPIIGRELGPHRNIKLARGNRCLFGDDLLLEKKVFNRRPSTALYINSACSIWGHPKPEWNNVGAYSWQIWWMFTSKPILPNIFFMLCRIFICDRYFLHPIFAISSTTLTDFALHIDITWHVKEQELSLSTVTC